VTITTLCKLLDGQECYFDWGENGQNVFRKTRNVPVILIADAGNKESAKRLFKEEHYYSRLFFVEWVGRCPVV
jgi:hypothetical protein